MAAEMCTPHSATRIAPGDANLPVNLPGHICLTSPFGPYAAPRFNECCSGKVYNVTSPVQEDDPAYPLSCAVVCQVDKKYDSLDPMDANHANFTDFHMCILDGGKDKAALLKARWSYLCYDAKVKGVPDPIFTTTPTGVWATASLDLPQYSLVPLPTSKNDPRLTVSPLSVESSTATGSNGDASATTAPTTSAESNASTTTNSPDTKSSSPVSKNPSSSGSSPKTTDKSNSAARGSQPLGIAKPYLVGAVAAILVAAL